MRSPLISIVAMLIFSCLSWHSYAAIESYNFANEVERKRYQSFIEEMRCPKCQNQNLAGSDSPISLDLRREIYEMIKADKSDREVVDYMVARYGDFILYKPRVTPATYLLWAAPVVLLISGIVVILIMLRQRRRSAVLRTGTELTDTEQARLNSLLSNGADNSNNNPKNKKDSPQ